MDALCRRKGVAFAMIMLLATDEARSHYLAYCRARGITCFDCVYPLTRDMRIPVEDHPNAALNELWVRRIDEQVQAKFQALSGHSAQRVEGESDGISPSGVSQLK